MPLYALAGSHPTETRVNPRVIQDLVKSEYLLAINGGRILDASVQLWEAKPVPLVITTLKLESGVYFANGFLNVGTEDSIMIYRRFEGKFTEYVCATVKGTENTKCLKLMDSYH